jgi:hypothetical protein
MDDRRTIMIQLCLWIIVSMLFGCAAGPLVTDEPPWYLMSSGAFDTSSGRAFYGIGKAEGSRNATLLRAAAANRARKELAVVVDRYVAELYQSSQTIPALTMEAGEQMIGGLVRDAMKHSVISDQWNDPEKGQLYALCRLDLDRFKQVLAAQTAIPPAVRAAMAAETEKVHAMMVRQSR